MAPTDDSQQAPADERGRSSRNHSELTFDNPGLTAVTPTLRFPGVVLTILAGLFVSGSVAADAPVEVSYNRDIRPILSDNCFSCHGPSDAGRKSGLRLDQASSPEALPDSGLPAIVPGQPEASELIARIESSDLHEVMPPPASNKTLTARQKDLLRRWIAQGARYQQHWSYVAPARPPLPAVARHDWPQNPIDAFVLARLEHERLVPAPEADRSTLIRRVSLDLLGLPPARGEVEAFLADNSPAAYEAMVDRLLASPRLGERLAVDWLDAARFADTNGYQVDRDREQFAWRDWVISAFNRNLPFDEFTIEQLAGDLLPLATRDQRIATGFHRNHMVNEEGGVIPEEFLAEYTADRVETTATVWLGQTFNCARCHDHKFDPFTQRDFYGLKAFFHNVSERGIANYAAHIRINNAPYLRLATSEQESHLEQLKQQVAAAETKHKELEQAKAEETARTAAAQAAEVRPEGAGSERPAAPPVPADPERDFVKESADALAHLKAQLAAFETSIPTALVMDELPEPRKTYVLERGAYDKPGAEVAAATPTVLPPLAPSLPQNRLGLARWLMSAENPLTARVTVNRYWQSLFGTGLVETSNDFGSQGAAPSHPELLDWLAVEFRESGWNVKQLLRLIVTSATYRQSSRLTDDLRARDPGNRLLARGPRFRLQAEFVRDQALAASGLLVPKLGGPSVKPYHPPGHYEQVVAVVWVDKAYQEGTGDDLHRRSLYTYWKRSVPHPSLLAFDAPFRETCTVQRPRTNTPVQALALMNDPTYVEAARFLAARMLREADETDVSRIAHGFWLVLARAPRAEELTLLIPAVERFRREYLATPEGAESLLKLGVPLPEAGAGVKSIEPRELAAYTLLASLLLCRDEAVMKN